MDHQRAQASDGLSAIAGLLIAIRQSVSLGPTEADPVFVAIGGWAFSNVAACLENVHKTPRNSLKSLNFKNILTPLYGSTEPLFFELHATFGARLTSVRPSH